MLAVLTKTALLSSLYDVAQHQVFKVHLAMKYTDV